MKVIVDNYIQSLFEQRNKSKLFKIKNSKVAGKGTFATQNINKNTNLGLAFSKIRNTGVPDRDYERTLLGAYTNHSEDPNLIFKKENNKYYFLTNQNIKRGQELFIDYRTFDWEGKQI